MKAQHYSVDTDYISVTIPAGATKSAAINLHGLEMAGLIIPAEFDGNTLSLEMSDSLNGNYVPVHNGAGVALSFNVAAGSYAPISNLSLTAGLTYIKLVAANTQSGSDSIIKIAARQI